jgi:hypothetical protein
MVGGGLAIGAYGVTWASQTIADLRELLALVTKPPAAKHEKQKCKGGFHAPFG